MCRARGKGDRRCDGGVAGNARRRVRYAEGCYHDAVEARDATRAGKYFDSMVRQREALLAEHDIGCEPRALAEADVVPAARIVATRAHEGQFRRDGRPYIVHPQDVAERLEHVGLPPYVVAAGWLHDTVEDTDLTLDRLHAGGFPAQTVDIVRNVTHEEGEDYQTQTMPRAVASLDSAAVKDADNQHNTSDKRGPTPAQYAKQVARDRKYLEARRAIKARFYGTPEGQAEAQRLFAQAG